MSIFDRIFDYFSDQSGSASAVSSTEINPANGLPMVSGIGSVDVMGNPYGTDLDRIEDGSACGTGHDWHNDHVVSDWNHLSHGGGFDHDPFSGDW